MKTASKLISIFVVCLVLLGAGSCLPENDFFVSGVSSPAISLNGTWQVSHFAFDSLKHVENVIWKNVEVPGECMMQGFPVRHDEPFIYRKEFAVPADYSGKMIKLRFEGVYSYARVWINNIFIRDHSGGFTAWECDITQAVKPGETAVLMVEVTDKADEISNASGYATHQIGGILRSVTLLALPPVYPEFITITTDFDDDYRDAVLKVNGQTNLQAAKEKIRISLFDPENRKIRLSVSSVDITDRDFRISNTISGPIKWDAEHPNLYRLEVEYLREGRRLWRKSFNTGFREIEVQGNKLLVNGKPVKLRGACRHDVHPVLGRVSLPEYELKDVLLAKEANMNFIRTSHYPPSESFLDFCDKHGIYVEDETAVCFVDTWRLGIYYPGATQDNPEYTERYLSQLKEMVINHKNHPSVIMWSIANESKYGENFRKSHDWVKAADHSRPVIFSYPGKEPDSIRMYDILSFHYPDTEGKTIQYGGKTSEGFESGNMPALFDEWAHVACYNKFTITEDPNVRDFWGRSLDTMWQGVFDAGGALGGAIWGMIDETFMLPEDLPGFQEWWGLIDDNLTVAKFPGKNAGFGEWGIVDVWRRKKPEFINVVKAYSPVRVLQTENFIFTQGKEVTVPVQNRYDFTNLDEIKMRITQNGQSVTTRCPVIHPHSKGELLFTPEFSGMPVKLEFLNQEGRLIDTYILGIAERNNDIPVQDGNSGIELEESAERYIVACGNGLKFIIDKKTGLFAGIDKPGGSTYFSGPFLNVRALLSRQNQYPLFKNFCERWSLNSIEARKDGNTVKYELKGSYNGNLTVTFHTTVHPGGKITVDYQASGIPEGLLRESGIRFVFGNVFDSLSWKRIPYWSSYPEGHMSAASGRYPLYTSYNRIYREKPAIDWEYDKKSFYYSGTESENSDQLINAAKATKERVIECRLSGRQFMDVTVHGKGRDACRIEKINDNIHLLISNSTDYPDLGWGNRSGLTRLKGELMGSVELSIGQSQ